MIATLVATFGLATLGGAAMAQFSPGNLAVSIVDGNAYATPGILTSAATQQTFKEFTIAGVATGQFYNLPGNITNAASVQRNLTNSGTATSESRLDVSTDGRYLLVGGYDALIGTSAIAGTSVASVNRIAGRVDYSLAPGAAGAIDTSTRLTTAYDGSNIRFVTSYDGSGFWTAGTSANGNATGGTWYIPYGTSGGAQLQDLVDNTREVQIVSGNLYISSSSATLDGIAQVGNSGLPTTAGQPIGNGGNPVIDTGVTNHAFPNNGTYTFTSFASTYDFLFTDANTCYIADDRNGSAYVGKNSTDPGTKFYANVYGGLQKWTFDGTNWNLVQPAGTTDPTVPTFNIPTAPGAPIDPKIGVPDPVGIRSVSGYKASSGVVTLYVVTTDNRIGTIVDNAGSFTFTPLATAATNTAFRGVRVLPKVSGTLVIDGLASATTLPVVTFEFRTPGSTTPLFTKTATPAPNGTYVVQGVGDGTYDIGVKGANTLRTTLTNVVVNAVTTLPTVTLLGGDANGDNAVDNVDLGLLAVAYASSTGDSNFDPRADFNNDGSVDNLDLAILANNYALNGDD